MMRVRREDNTIILERPNFTEKEKKAISTTESGTHHTHRLLTLSTETVATLETGDFQLVAIIDEPI